MKFLMRNALRSNHVSEGILIKSISFDSLFFLFQIKIFKNQTWTEPWFWTWTWGYENSEDAETNPQDFKVTKNFSLHINLLRLDFFYKALEKDKNQFVIILAKNWQFPEWLLRENGREVKSVKGSAV